MPLSSFFSLQNTHAPQRSDQKKNTTLANVWPLFCPRRGILIRDTTAVRTARSRGCKNRAAQSRVHKNTDKSVSRIVARSWYYERHGFERRTVLQCGDVPNIRTAAGCRFRFRKVFGCSYIRDFAVHPLRLLLLAAHYRFSLLRQELDSTTPSRHYSGNCSLLSVACV